MVTIPGSRAVIAKRKQGIATKRNPKIPAMIYLGLETTDGGRDGFQSATMRMANLDGINAKSLAEVDITRHQTTTRPEIGIVDHGEIGPIHLDDIDHLAPLMTRNEGIDTARVIDPGQKMLLGNRKQKRPLHRIKTPTHWKT